MSKQLTETLINRVIREVKASGVRQDLPDPATRGLWLRINVTGDPTWVLRVRDATGRQRRFNLGSYPKMGLAAARSADINMKAAVRQGHDPIAERRDRRSRVRAEKASSAEGGAGTLRCLVELYGMYRGKDHRSWPRSRQKILNVFGPLLAEPLTGLTHAHFQRAANDYARLRSANTSNDAVRQVRPVLKWGSRSGYNERLLADIDPPPAPRVRNRYLSADELSALLRVLRSAESFQVPARCLKFILLTLGRLREVTELPWGEIDFKRAVWNLPAARNKSRRDHQVPLSRQAIELLRLQRPKAEPPPDALVFPTETGRPLTNWSYASLWFQQQSNTKGWQRHDLRRTGATTLGLMGVDPHIIESALNHLVVKSQLASIYSLSRYYPQKAEALQKLADHYDELERGAAKVIRLKR
jgi:integrase